MIAGPDSLGQRWDPRKIRYRRNEADRQLTAQNRGDQNDAEGNKFFQESQSKTKECQSRTQPNPPARMTGNKYKERFSFRIPYPEGKKEWERIETTQEAKRPRQKMESRSTHFQIHPIWGFRVLESLTFSLLFVSRRETSIQKIVECHL